MGLGLNLTKTKLASLFQEATHCLGVLLTSDADSLPPEPGGLGGEEGERGGGVVQVDVDAVHIHASTLADGRNGLSARQWKRQ